MLVAEQPIAVFPAPGSNCGHRAGCASTGRVSNPLGRFERFQVTSIPLSRTSPPDEGGPMDATGSGALPVPITRCSRPSPLKESVSAKAGATQPCIALRASCCTS